MLFLSNSTDNYERALALCCFQSPEYTFLPSLLVNSLPQRPKTSQIWHKIGIRGLCENPFPLGPLCAASPKRRNHSTAARETTITQKEKTRDIMKIQPTSWSHTQRQKTAWPSWRESKSCPQQNVTSVTKPSWTPMTMGTSRVYMNE